MILEAKQALLAEVVKVAQGQLGVEETPRGSNWGNIVKGYLAAVNISVPSSWCMAFAVWTVLAACKRRGLTLKATTLIATGGCAAQANHARGLGVLIAAGAVAAGTVRVLPGYLMLVWECSEGDWDYHHTGIVEVAPDKDGVFHTYEGNTNKDGGRQGYGVMRQTRNLHDKAGDGHPKYAFIAVV